MEEQLPDRLLSPDGRSGWYAHPPEGVTWDDEGTPWKGPRDGSVVRFMAEESVDVPLWGECGLIFVDGEDLVREWGVSEKLAAEIVAWGRASQGPFDPDRESQLDAEAARLIRRLDRELDHRFTIVYKP